MPIIEALLAFAALCAIGRQDWRTAPPLIILTLLIHLLRTHRGTPPRPAADELYGWPDAGTALADCAARVHGTPGGGLAAGVADGMDIGRVRAGVRGEESLACALRHYGILDDPDVDVFLSCRNPGDESGRTDVDCIILKGRTIWLLDAKHYRPSAPGLTLHPSPDGAGAGRAIDLPVRNRWGRTVRTYHASGNMSWATDSFRRILPHLTVRPGVLLCRTGGGVYGVARHVMFPGHIPVRQADRWLPCLRRELAATRDGRDDEAARRLDKLVK